MPDFGIESHDKGQLVCLWQLYAVSICRQLRQLHIVHQLHDSRLLGVITVRKSMHFPAHDHDKIIGSVEAYAKLIRKLRGEISGVTVLQQHEQNMIASIGLLKIYALTIIMQCFLDPFQLVGGGGWIRIIFQPNELH
ncbi:hypothetical protein D3C76_1409390 [compost metagenome]